MMSDAWTSFWGGISTRAAGTVLRRRCGFWPRGAGSLLWAQRRCSAAGEEAGTVATLCWEHGEATVAPWDGVNPPVALRLCKAPHKPFLVESSQEPEEMEQVPETHCADWETGDLSICRGGGANANEACLAPEDLSVSTQNPPSPSIFPGL